MSKKAEKKSYDMYYFLISRNANNKLEITYFEDKDEVIDWVKEMNGYTYTDDIYDFDCLDEKQFTIIRGYVPEVKVRSVISEILE